MSVECNRVKRFFDVENVAIIGASEHGLYPAGIIQNLLLFKFPGRIFPVNPKHKEIFGLRCYASIDQIAEKIDLAIVVVNRNLVLGSVQQCIQHGMKAILIISAGFAESDDVGKAIEKELATIIAASDTVVLGPNCAGYADLHARLIVTRLPCASKAGGVSFISQSGALMMALYGVFCDMGIGLNKIISVGNQMDVNLGEGIVYLSQDEKTRAIGSFIEGINEGQCFKQGLELALIAGKPVVLIKSGRTKSGQKAAATHTAAVAGSDRVFQAVCQQFGAALVDDTQSMMDLLKIHEAFAEKLAGFDRFMVVTQSGGMGSLTVDWMEKEGLPLAEMGSDLEDKLKGIPHLAAITHWENPADVRGTSLRGEATLQTLSPFMEDNTIDLVLLLLARTTIQEADYETAKAIVSVQQKTKKPLLVVWVGQRVDSEHAATPIAVRLLEESAVPVFTQSSDAIVALSAARRFWKFRQTYLQHSETLTRES